MRKGRIILPLAIALATLTSCEKTEYFEVTFDAAGGTAIAPQRIKKGEKMTKPDNPTKDKSDFLYWCSDPSLETEFTAFDQPVTKSFTLYAKYANIIGIKTFVLAKTFYVGDEITKNDFSVSVQFDNGGTKALTPSSWKCDELTNDKYVFTLTDIYDGGKFSDGKVFNISYLEFKDKVTILPTVLETSKFSMQYVNLLNEDVIEHTVYFEASEGYSFSSSNENKLQITSQSVVDGQYVIKYKLINNDSITKDDKLFILASSAQHGGGLIDYLLIQIFNNSNDSLSFIDNEDGTCFVFCSAGSKKERKEFDPCGDGTLLIPSYDLHGHPVVSVSNSSSSTQGAFSSCSKITYVELPETIMEIDKNAFSGSGVEYIFIPKSVLTIGDYAFNACKSLTVIDFQSGSLLTDIGELAFQNCTNLTSFVVPKYVIKIQRGCFNLCKNLSRIIVSNDSMLTSVGIEAFNGINAAAINVEENATYVMAYDENLACNTHFCLTSIANEESVTEYTVADDCVVISISAASTYKYLKTINVSNSVLAIADHCFMECDALENFNIDIDNSKLLGIGEFAFGSSIGSQTMHIKSINIPASTLYIGRSCFSAFNTDLKNAYFKDSKGWHTFNDEGEIIEFKDLNDSKKAAYHLINDISNGPLQKQ